jgi:hypothetical protein
MACLKGRNNRSDRSSHWSRLRRPGVFGELRFTTKKSACSNKAGARLQQLVTGRCEVVRDTLAALRLPGWGRCCIRRQGHFALRGNASRFFLILSSPELGNPRRFQIASVRVMRVTEVERHCLTKASTRMVPTSTNPAPSDSHASEGDRILSKPAAIPTRFPNRGPANRTDHEPIGRWTARASAERAKPTDGRIQEERRRITGQAVLNPIIGQDRIPTDNGTF